MSRKKKTATNFISYLLVAMLLIAVLGFFSFFTNGFKQSFSLNTVKYNGKVLSKTDSSLTLPLGEELKFDVNIVGENKEYSVEVVPCGSFSYVINGSVVRYENTITEISDKFYSVNKTTDGFVLTLTDLYIESILKDYHLGAEITFEEINGKRFNLYGSYYALVISIEGESSDYKIPFSVVSPVESVELGGNIIL